jgi:cation:H+ antiporter
MSAFGLFLLGFVLLVFGADSLQRALAGVARRFGRSAASSGLLVPAFVAALPALALSAFAFAAGEPALALGNAIGGGIASLGAVAGLLVLLFTPVPAMRSLSTQAVLVAVSVGLLLVFGRGGELARWEGALLVAAWLAGTAAVFGRSRTETEAVRTELAEAAETSTILGQNVVRLAISGALLYFGSRWIVQGAPEVGRSLGLDPLSTGLLVLATGSTLALLVPAAMAAARGQANVALAQVLGAATGLSLLATGLLALATTVEFPPQLLRSVLPVLFVLSAALWLLLRRGARLGRREGVLLLAVFVAWLGMGLAHAWP